GLTRIANSEGWKPSRTTRNRCDPGEVGRFTSGVLPSRLPSHQTSPHGVELMNKWPSAATAFGARANARAGARLGGERGGEVGGTTPTLSLRNGSLPGGVSEPAGGGENIAADSGW